MKQEFSWLAVEDVGKSPTMCWAVCHKFESNVAKMGCFSKARQVFPKKKKKRQ